MCLDWGLPEPLFEKTSGGLVLNLRRYKVTENTLAELNEEERTIIDYIRNKRRIFRRECAQLLEVSSTTAYRYLKSLEERGFISKQGKGKNTHYVLA